MATLKNLTANGWKADNGFRTDYLMRAREAIKREFPNTDIMPHLHIYSKITTWKRQYNSLKMMLNLSGIGFNSDGTYKIECDDEQWHQFVKKYRHAKYMRNKSWPQFEDWMEVFGKDRADGERRVDVGAAVGQIYRHREEVPADDSQSHPMTWRSCFDEVFPEGVLPEMIDESQSVTDGGFSGRRYWCRSRARGEHRRYNRYWIRYWFRCCYEIAQKGCEEAQNRRQDGRSHISNGSDTHRHKRAPKRDIFKDWVRVRS